ncbi:MULTISPECIES: DUF4352 domain-containing protein [Jeotgalicoccus]|uniref:Uncharacterized protein DUF4352 n=1 Tax=Jeotgalicoccus halotolerans TaxID=157227 RepID=A0A3E0AZU9_9STAP|nr:MULTISPECIES: DUF4352 domain-containing protein [Jeotgalicoccus]REG25260.1 uncharacterized protein DUF4352 [Jeotgalicoccus halotolerans]
MSEEERKQQKKRGGCLKWVLIIFGVLILLGACGALLGGGDNATNTTPEEATKESEEPAEEVETESGEQEESAEEDEEVVEEDEAVETVGIGETLTVDDIDFTVNDMYQQDSVGDVIASNANDTYLILDVSVTNNQNEAVTLMDSYFKIVDGETVFEPDGTASMTANQAISPDNLGLLAEEINPGSSRDALIVYDITQSVIDSQSKQLQVQSGMFGTETGIINLQ